MTSADVVRTPLNGDLLHEIDVPADDRLQLILHLNQIEQCPSRGVIKRHQDVDVAIRAELRRLQHGPEEAQLSNPPLAAKRFNALAIKIERDRQIDAHSSSFTPSNSLPRLSITFTVICFCSPVVPKMMWSRISLLSPNIRYSSIRSFFIDDIVKSDSSSPGTISNAQRELEDDREARDLLTALDLTGVTGSDAGEMRKSVLSQPRFSRQRLSAAPNISASRAAFFIRHPSKKSFDSARPFCHYRVTSHRDKSSRTSPKVELAGDHAMTEATAHIRRLFLGPKDTYSDAEAAEILGMELVGLRKRMESGEVEAVRNCCGMTVCRKELISFAMDYWPQDAIEEALGADLAKGIPKLLRLADLHVRIPRFEILALECLAQRDGKSVDALLARELLDVVSAESNFLAAKIPGFTAALR